MFGRASKSNLMFGLVVVTFGLGLLTSCGPSYPNCETDAHCKNSEKGQKQGKLVCVNGKCQECGKDADCGDPSLQCNGGVCEEIPGYCESDDDCDGARKCRDNRCGPECVEKEECGEDEVCEGGSCVKEDECSIDADCQSDKICKAGECQDKPKPDCTPETVYFDFDKSNIRPDAESTLKQNLDCLEKYDADILLEGHCDERGTNEYNIALGERRAQSVKDYLTRMGIGDSRLEVTSYGEERLARQCGLKAPDSCHQKNRRVEFVIQD